MKGLVWLLTAVLFAPLLAFAGHDHDSPLLIGWGVGLALLGGFFYGRAGR